jgi:cysteinyl-tRNA synthetase
MMGEAQGKRIVSVQWKKKFMSGLEKDLNTCEALTATWELLRSDEEAKVIVGTILDFDQVLGLRLDKVKVTDVKMETESRKEVEKLIKQREKARQSKDWTAADKIRDELLKKYRVKVEDTVEGQKWGIDE